MSSDGQDLIGSYRGPITSFSYTLSCMKQYHVPAKRQGGIPQWKVITTGTHYTFTTTCNGMATHNRAYTTVTGLFCETGLCCTVASITHSVCMVDVTFSLWTV